MRWISRLALNVRTLSLKGDKTKDCPDGDAAALLQYCTMYSNFPLIAMAETRLSGSGKRDLGDYTMYRSGGKVGRGLCRRHGVALLIRNDFPHTIHHFEAISDRLLLLHGKFKGAPLTVIVAYAPCTTKNPAVTLLRRAEFFTLLQLTINGLPPALKDTLLLVGDFNARVGKALRSDPHDPALPPTSGSWDRMPRPQRTRHSPPGHMP